MSLLPAYLPAWWTWHRSAHLRIVWLASAWLLLILSAPLGAVFLPLAALRFLGSTVQTWLNLNLGKAVPIGDARRSDWMLFGLMMVFAHVAALAREAGPALPGIVLYAPVLLPFSFIQIRMVVRSYRAGAGERIRTAEMARMTGVVERRALPAPHRPIPIEAYRPLADRAA